jgi:hypothetical protein
VAIKTAEGVEVGVSKKAAQSAVMQTVQCAAQVWPTAALDFAVVRHLRCGNCMGIHAGHITLDVPSSLPAAASAATHIHSL